MCTVLISMHNIDLGHLLLRLHAAIQFSVHAAIQFSVHGCASMRIGALRMCSWTFMVPGILKRTE